MQVGRKRIELTEDTINNSDIDSLINDISSIILNHK